MHVIYFAAGCFWGVEHFFAMITGVEDTSVGYMGGHQKHPSYEEVKSQKTGHAEVVRVRWDPAKTNLNTLLEQFFACHDPTSLDRQGPDSGSQYRSAVFCPDQKTQHLVQKYIQELTDSLKYVKPVKTSVEVAGCYYLAEEYHQKYFVKNPGAACTIG